MKAAIIPPFAHLETTRDREFHLLLAHLLDPSLGHEYRTFYTSLRASRPGAFLILDNSAHENTIGQTIQSVLSLGQSLGVNEIVVPDHLFNHEETLANAKLSFEYLLTPGGSSLFRTFYPRLMIVAQGKSRRDYERCVFNLALLIREFRREFNTRYKFVPQITFGVSKDYEIWEGGLHRLLKSTIIPTASSFEAQIHVLGWGHNLWGHRAIAEDFGDQIRSTDSAKPWVYGYNNTRLDSHYLDIPTYPKRPDEYFNLRYDDLQTDASLWNVNVFDATCRGEVLV